MEDTAVSKYNSNSLKYLRSMAVVVGPNSMAVVVSRFVCTKANGHDTLVKCVCFFLKTAKKTEKILGLDSDVQVV